jgi:apolipoprotein N-acyltransferase
MDSIPALVADVTAGTGGTIVSGAGNASLGTTICFETTRPDIARRMRRAGASALVQISNEAWFGPGAAARQMLGHAVFRAVENDVQLIRATNSGLSAAVSPSGYVEGETSAFESATRHWRVLATEEANNRPLTFYTRHGDVLAVSCAGASILFAVAALVARKIERRDSNDD